MPGRRVALVCIDPWEDATEFHPFNYSVRRVQAALVARGVEALLVESTSRDVGSLDVGSFVARVEELEPDIVGFSAYVWSFPTFVEIARRLKQKRPELVTIFGGPSARVAMFELEPFAPMRRYVDAIVAGEGEEVMLRIVALPSLDAASLARLPGVSVPTASGFRSGPPAETIQDLDALPSPYALGLVPPGVSAHLETFRGCPLSCSFCQWGDAQGGNRAFDVDTLTAELEHFKRLGMRDAVLVDAGLNLNARAFRALAEAERRTGALRDVALSFEVYPSHLKDEHLEFLAQIKVDSIGLGLQSYDPAVLKRVQRTFDPVRFERVARQLSTLGNHVTIEIIMGLPGDRPASFRETLARARELPADVRVYHCLVLPDALMTRAGDWAAMSFDPWTLQMKSCAGWSERELASMREELSKGCAESDGWDQGTFWLFPQHHRRGVSGPSAVPVRDAVAPVELASEVVHDAAPELTGKAMAAVAQATSGRWSVSTTLEASPARWSVELSVSGVPLILDIEPALPSTRAFVVEQGVAISYRPGAASADRSVLGIVRALSPALAALFTEERARPTKRLQVLAS